MPFMKINGAELHYEVTGQGAETIVFSHGLLMSGEMFRPQVDALKERFRCVVYDHRGQGRSEVTESGYDMDSVAADAAELIHRLDCSPCHFVGLSMGGFVGLRLAIRHPELLRSLSLLDTSADAEPNKRSYRALAFIGRWLGFRIVANPVAKIIFGHSFMNDDAREAERLEWRKQLIANDRVGTTRAAGGVIEREAVLDGLPKIALPVLVLVGEEDTATPPEKARRIADRIPGARLEIIPGAGHTSTIENPGAVSEALIRFLGDVGEA